MSKCDNCSMKGTKCEGIGRAINSMCNQCVKLNNGCKGETCMVYTGCIFREIKKED